MTLSRYPVAALGVALFVCPLGCASENTASDPAPAAGGSTTAPAAPTAETPQSSAAGGAASSDPASTPLPASGGAPGSAGGAGNTGGSDPAASGGAEAQGGADSAPDGTGLTPFYADESVEDRMAKYHFQEQGGTVVIEAEHFAMQVYGNDDYDGKRWWMVQSADFDAKAHPGFAELCQSGVQELMDLDTQVGGQTIRDIITNHSDKLYWTADDIQGVSKEGKQLTKSGEQIVEESGCDPDESHIDGETSGGAYIELLPDMLYDNNNAIPHAGCNWYNPEQAPRAYYRVTFSSGGNYKVCIRGYRTGSDSGSAHGGFVKNVGDGESGFSRLDISGGSNGRWTWTSTSTNVEPGEGWIVLAGREDGFEIDKLVVTQGGCPSGSGPAESATVQ